MEEDPTALRDSNLLAKSMRILRSHIQRNTCGKLANEYRIIGNYVSTPKFLVINIALKDVSPLS